MASQFWGRFVTKPLYNVFLPDQGDPVLWRAAGMFSHRVEPPMRCKAERVLGVIGDGRLHLYVSGLHVSRLPVATDLTNKRKIKETLPYLLEDHLAGPLEDLHFVWKRGRNGVIAGVVDRAKMREWTMLIETHGWPVERLSVDWMLLPDESDGVVIHDDGFSACLSGEVCFSGSLESLPQWLDLAVVGAEEETRVFQVFSLLPDEEGLPNLPVRGDGWTLSFQQDANGQMPPPGHMAAEDAMELRQGEFSSTSTFDLFWKNYLPVAVALAFAWVVAWVSVVYESGQLRERAGFLSRNTVEIYRETFPEAKVVELPRAQMEQKMQRWREATGQREGDLIALLQRAGLVLREHAGDKVAGMDYEAGRLRIDFNVVSHEQAQELVEAFNGVVGIASQLVDAREGRATIELRHTPGAQNG